MDLGYTETFEYIIYKTTNVDWIDKTTPDIIETISCRVTEMTKSDLDKIGWNRDENKQKMKLYTYPKYIFTKWQIIKYEWKEWRVLRNYRPKDLSWNIPYSKIFIMEE